MDVLIILIVVILVVIFQFIGKHSNKKNISKDLYQTRSPLFTEAERSFLGVLDQAFSDRYRIFGKVRVADILTPSKGLDRKTWQITFNKIAAKHFDYVLCTKDSLEVIAVIELDDKSHNSKSAHARDSFLESACMSAGLKLIRFPAQQSYQISVVIKNVTDVLEAE